VRHWQTLVAARAVENVAYVAAVGQPGPAYSGHSCLVDPRGDVLVEAGDGQEVLVGEVSRGLVREARTENPSLLNRRDEVRLPATGSAPPRERAGNPTSGVPSPS